jgi:hypothetical protein
MVSEQFFHSLAQRHICLTLLFQERRTLSGITPFERFDKNVAFAHNSDLTRLIA